MIFIVQLLTVVYCLSFLVSAWHGNGALHDSVVTIAISLAGVAIIRQILIIIFSLLEKRKYRKNLAAENADSRIQPTVSIIVPAYNEGKVIERALRSMFTLQYPNYEILFIDDGSTDDTYSIAKELVPESNGKLRVFKQPNQGKSQALNLGVRISQSSLVLCVDADSTLKEDGLDHAVRHFRDADVAAVAGVVEVNTGGSNLLTRLQRTEYLISQRLTRAAIGFFSCIPIVPGPAGMFRRQAIVDAGGYISAEECFAEDAELTIRLLADGHKIVAEPKLVSLTQAPADMFSLLRQRYRWCRGLMQALFLNSKKLIFGKSRKGPLLFFYLLSENLFFPTLCFGVALFFLANTLVFGEITSFTIGLMLLVGLELVGLFLVMERKREFPIYLFEYILIRFVYAYVLTAWTLLCLNDEMRAVKMSWDKLERYGAKA